MRKDIVFSVQTSSSIVCSIDVQTVWLILFCIVVFTNRGLSCTVYLLTDWTIIWSVLRNCKENDIESVGNKKLNPWCWVQVLLELWKLEWQNIFQEKLLIDYKVHIWTNLFLISMELHVCTMEGKKAIWQGYPLVRGGGESCLDFCLDFWLTAEFSESHRTLNIAEN